MSNKAIDGFTVLGNFAGKRVELSSYQEEYSEFEVIAKIYNWGVSCVLGLVMEEWQSIMGICFGGAIWYMLRLNMSDLDFAICFAF